MPLAMVPSQSMLRHAGGSRAFARASAAAAARCPRAGGEEPRAASQRCRRAGDKQAGGQQDREQVAAVDKPSLRHQHQVVHRREARQHGTSGDNPGPLCIGPPRRPIRRAQGRTPATLA